MQAFLKAATTPGIEGQVINAGSSRDVSIGELVEIAKALTGSDVPVTSDPQRVRPAASELHRLLSDSGKARDLLGWEATIPLQEGLAETLAYVQNRFSPELASQYVI